MTVDNDNGGLLSMDGNDKDAKELDSKTIENIKADAQKVLTRLEADLTSNDKKIKRHT